MSAVNDMLTANKKYAAAFRKGHLKKQPAKRVAVLACMDARMDPARILGLQEGDANVLRNEGGRVNDYVVRSLLVARALLDMREIVVLHHTDCGLQAKSAEEFRRAIERELNVTVEHEFPTFADLDQSVRDDIVQLRLIKEFAGEVPVRGFVYDVKTGLLREVVAV